MDNHAEDLSISADALENSPTPHPPLQQYVWVACDSAGWQALVHTSELGSSKPVPPKCVTSKILSPANNQKPRSPRSIAVIPDHAATVRSPSRSRSPKPKICADMSPSSTNFVECNIRKAHHSPQNRVTKTTLLDQASDQLRESEIIGSSLAERLKLLQKKIQN